MIYITQIEASASDAAIKSYKIKQNLTTAAPPVFLKHSSDTAAHWPCHLASADLLTAAIVVLTPVWLWETRTRGRKKKYPQTGYRDTQINIKSYINPGQTHTNLNCTHNYEVNLMSTCLKDLQYLCAWWVLQTVSAVACVQFLLRTSSCCVDSSEWKE